MIRDQNSKILVEHHLSYELRNDYISGYEICNTECNNLELCILTKNSNGSINGWFDSQCSFLPNNFEFIRKKYSDHRQTFIIYSQRLQAKSSATLYIADYKYLIIIIFLGKKLSMYVEQHF